ncbi:MAG: hypothetical protein QHH06_08920 [Clostridiales bacterium]|nr:hypothetical protein [Eubacteriales bacterium]MDH7566587.1 hypothetical protein [Clostridiales bacterium]
MLIERTDTAKAKFASIEEALKVSLAHKQFATNYICGIVDIAL